MSPFFFWTASALMLVFGAAVIVNRNPVASALSLVVSFLGLAALFMSLDAFFIGIIQVLVYAGAVMVLFLFIIMLLDLRAEERRRINFVAFAGGTAVAVIFFGQLYLVIGHLRQATASFRCLAGRKERRRAQRRPAPFRKLQSAVPNHRRAHSRCDHRRGRAEQTRTALRMVTLGDYLFVSGLLFTIGFAGVLLRRNIIIIFMSLELMLNAANLSLVAFSRFRVDSSGLPNYHAQVFVFFIITVAAAEVAVGLAIIVALYRARRTTHVEDINTLKF